MEFRALSYRSTFPLNLKSSLSGTWKRLRFAVRPAMYIGVAAILEVHCVSAYTQTSTQTGEWVWMGGSSTVPKGAESGPPGVYGTLGTPAAGNVPGGRSIQTNWADGNGNFWIFQAWGFDSTGTKGALNDLWKFNPTVGQWAWMGGSSVADTALSGIYGTLGLPALGNLPGFRNGETIWTDRNGKIWLFGGQSYDSASPLGLLNDFWRFDPSTAQWTWMGGSSTVPSSNWQNNSGIAGVYGTLGTPAIGNFPGSRTGASGWTDSSGDLWMFGGSGYDSAGSVGLLDDLWKFDPATNQWAWMGGSSTIPPNPASEFWVPGVPGNYGVLGVPGPANQPGSRSGGFGWIDGSGNFWLYGGSGLSRNGLFGALTDLWEYAPITNEWVWMDGAEDLTTDPNSGIVGMAVGCQAAQYGPIGEPSNSTIPGCGTLEAWSDTHGDLWLFGGGGDGLWEFFPYSRQWILWGGQSMIAWPGVYGTQGVPAIGNIPGYRTGGASWTDSSGNLWLFGGTAVDSNNVQGYLNDLWEYIPAPSPVLPAATPTFDPPSGIYPTKQRVTIADVTPKAAIYYTTDGTPPTTNSAEYIGPIEVNQGEQIQAIASANGYSTSSVGSAMYWLVLPTPTFTPPSGGATLSGTYSPPLSVSIDDSTPGTTIYFTRDGTAPTRNSAVYSSPISVSTNTILKAFATESGFGDSIVATAWYVPNPLLPGFTPPAGTYTGPVSVFIGNAVQYSTIYYTTDGTTPSTSSTVYSGPVNVTTTETLKAIATMSGATSPVATATYTILPPVIQVAEISLPSTASTVVGSTVAITATVTPANSTNPALNWASSNPNIASVNASGVVTGVSNGTTQITATSTDGSGITSNICTVTVNAPFTVGPSTPSGNTATVEPGGTAIYSLALTPAAGTTLLSPVTFSATGLPAGATAAFAPGTVVAGSGTTSLSLSIQTLTTAAHSERTFRTPVSLLYVLLLPIAGMCWRKRTGSSFHLMSSVLFLALILIIALAMSACSGKGGGAGGGGGKSPASSTITVIASNGQVQATTEVVLTIQ